MSCRAFVRALALLTCSLLHPSAALRAAFGPAEGAEPGEEAEPKEKLPTYGETISVTASRTVVTSMRRSSSSQLPTPTTPDASMKASDTGRNTRSGSKSITVRTMRRRNTTVTPWSFSKLVESTTGRPER